MASGKPIVSTIQMGYCPLKKYNCGISVKNCTAEGLADSIKQILSLDKEEYNKMCENAKNAAKEFDYSILANKLLNVVNNTIEINS